MKDRIRHLMESQNMTQQMFAQFLEMSPASLSSIFSERTRPTLNTVEAIKKKLPNVNIEWLMFGSGDPYTSDDDQNDGSGEVSNDNQGTLFNSLDDQQQSLDFDVQSSMSAIHPSSHGVQTSSHNNPQAQHIALQAGQATQRASAPSRNARNHDVVRDELYLAERPQRKVTEIRVYYDDLTYETFVPAKK